jgi:hypothetical protein
MLRTIFKGRSKSSTKAAAKATKVKANDGNMAAATVVMTAKQFEQGLVTSHGSTGQSADAFYATIGRRASVSRIADLAATVTEGDDYKETDEKQESGSLSDDNGNDETAAAATSSLSEDLATFMSSHLAATGVSADAAAETTARLGQRRLTLPAISSPFHDMFHPLPYRRVSDGQLLDNDTDPNLYWHMQGSFMPVSSSLEKQTLTSSSLLRLSPNPPNYRSSLSSIRSSDQPVLRTFQASTSCHSSNSDSKETHVALTSITWDLDEEQQHTTLSSDSDTENDVTTAVSSLKIKVGGDEEEEEDEDEVMIGKEENGCGSNVIGRDAYRVDKPVSVVSASCTTVKRKTVTFDDRACIHQQQHEQVNIDRTLSPPPEFINNNGDVDNIEPPSEASLTDTAEEQSYEVMVKVIIDNDKQQKLQSQTLLVARQHQQNDFEQQQTPVASKPTVAISTLSLTVQSTADVPHVDGDTAGNLVQPPDADSLKGQGHGMTIGGSESFVIVLTGRLDRSSSLPAALHISSYTTNETDEAKVKLPVQDTTGPGSRLPQTDNVIDVTGNLGQRGSRVRTILIILAFCTMVSDSNRSLKQPIRVRISCNILLHGFTKLLLYCTGIVDRTNRLVHVRVAAAVEGTLRHVRSPSSRGGG